MLPLAAPLSLLYWPCFLSAIQSIVHYYPFLLPFLFALLKIPKSRRKALHGRLSQLDLRVARAEHGCLPVQMAPSFQTYRAYYQGINSTLIAHDSGALRQFPDLPAIGYSAPLLSFISAFQYFLRGREMIQQGYDKVCCALNTSSSVVLK